MTMAADAHALPDVLQPGLRVVFCGTAAGTESARRGAYYAGPNNSFWATLHRCGLTPRQLTPEEFPTLPAFGLGLTDLAKCASGMDRHLARYAFDRAGLSAKVQSYCPRILAFTSKRAGEEYLLKALGYGLQPETIGVTRLFVLPSPSGAARAYWSIEPWKELAVISSAA